MKALAYTVKVVLFTNGKNCGINLLIFNHESCLSNLN